MFKSGQLQFSVTYNFTPYRKILLLRSSPGKNEDSGESCGLHLTTRFSAVAEAAHFEAKGLSK